MQLRHRLDTDCGQAFPRRAQRGESTQRQRRLLDDAESKTGAGKVFPRRRGNRSRTSSSSTGWPENIFRRDPIGKKIADDDLSPKSIREIIGVVADVREGTLDSDIWPAEYEDINQDPQNYFAVAVRTAQDEKAVADAGECLASGRSEPGRVRRNHNDGPIEASQTALLHRFSTWLVGGFAVMALVLGVVGLYGVIAFSVSRRTRDIGVRMALGAQRGAVYKLVMRQAGWLTAAGIGIGLVCSIGASLLMRKILFGVQACDVPTLAGVAVVLGSASLAASFLPAHRAASVNPTDALRAE